MKCGEVKDRVLREPQARERRRKAVDKTHNVPGDEGGSEYSLEIPILDSMR